ncbi:DUF6390 family protein [Mycolicibacterium poriferae]|uniref:Uncharacterized protein n=1 Tax=Mycolicibacterium poriferae TaxID=39694 RepID=A0A6N4VCK4_9MYCO|nr:DUF6390 family protein [Mycolicibacterium poriferae]MCV7265800.1 hypothetical protein [Mycolicibacterium poriferae]BBX51798.1 hypothetical protein MPOR_28240 [Mycolicibacterium poriferae]
MAEFARYAFPPNELGYCGPAGTVQLTDGTIERLTASASEFDGALPYLAALADSAGVDDPLDDAVAHGYWVGGSIQDRVDGVELLGRLRTAFHGQVTGLLHDVDSASAHHSFHVFVVYPWSRLLERGAGPALHVLQQCRVRWGTVQAVRGDHIELASPPLLFESGRLRLGEPVTETVRWRCGGASLTAAPRTGQLVSAHWDWVCGELTDADRAALEHATRRTLDMTNAARSR